VRPDADVVVCSWAGDDAELTLAVLRLAAGQAEPGRVHLVDMSPDERLADRARAIPGVRVAWVPGSSGLGESRQHGVSVASGRFVAFLDSDAKPREGWLSALRAAVEPPDVAVAGGPVLPVWPDGVRVPRAFRTAPAGDFLSMLDLGGRALDVPRVLPGNMIVDRSLTGDDVFARDLGRREGDLLGAEEIEMMVRVAAGGHRLVYVPAAAVDHRTSADRMSWRWMWRRLHAAGRESAAHRAALAPMPRVPKRGDRLFLAAVAVPYLWGRHVSGRRLPHIAPTAASARCGRSRTR
jgi:GT2 family glycosyltransferase